MTKETSLESQLGMLRSAAAERTPEEIRTLAARFVVELEQATVRSALAVGARAPDFILPAADDDRKVWLAEELRHGPVVLSFYRGQWCPYCNLEVNGVQQRYQDMLNLGVHRTRPLFEFRGAPRQPQCTPCLQDYRGIHVNGSSGRVGETVYDGQARTACAQRRQHAVQRMPQALAGSPREVVYATEPLRPPFSDCHRRRGRARPAPALPHCFLSRYAVSPPGQRLISGVLPVIAITDPGRAGGEDESQMEGNMTRKSSIEVESVAAFEEVMQSPEPLLVDYYADRCGPCRALAPNIERVALAQAGRLRVVKVNVDALPELAERARVREIPALHFHRDHRRVAVLTGFRTAEALTAELSRYGLIPDSPVHFESAAESPVSRGQSWAARLFGRLTGSSQGEANAPSAPADLASFRFLESDDELAAIIRSSSHRPTTIFLHDPWCPISARAFGEMEKLGGEVPSVDVSRQRRLSSEIERRTGIRHESPQIIVLRDAVAVWDASHGRVTAGAVRAALGNLDAGPSIGQQHPDHLR